MDETALRSTHDRPGDAPGGRDALIPEDGVSVRRVSRTYHSRREGARHALDDISVQIAPGSWVTLLGANGAGKSTLLAMLAGIDRPDAGTVCVFGNDTTSSEGRRAIRKHLGIVFQSPSLDRLLTVRENLVLHGVIGGLSRASALSRATELAARLGFADRIRSRVGALSGGLMRRVDLARAVMLRPRLLLLDEPSTGLDPQARLELMALLYDARTELPGLIVVMSSHLIEEADRADRVIMMSSGRIVADDTPDALRQSAGAAVFRLQTDDRDTAYAIIGRDGVLQHHADRAIVSVQSQEAAGIVAGRLAAARLPFEYGPPLLSDVYLQRAGGVLISQDTA
ncbi:MAG: ABC transporter ATP-binding protein [Phycisphaeraceae bacterium]|nr:ABC transporter ATP-binding protein [Phycisphaeraceae bacterium]